MHPMLAFHLFALIAYDIMHIDHVNEVPQQQPLIEEPDDQEQEEQPRKESPQAAPEAAPEDTDLSEEGKAGSCKSQLTN